MQDEENTKNQDINGEVVEAEIPEEVEDDILEFEFNDDGEEDLKKTLKKLRADLKVAKKEKEEYLTGWQKERADFANYKKDETERNTKFREYAKEQVLESFLSVNDSFNMAFANKEAWEKVDKAWRTGIEYIYNQMQNTFAEFGVSAVGIVGEKFDPTIHESIETVGTDEENKDHTVATVTQKGYKFGERILRPARVNVFEFKE